MAAVAHPAGNGSPSCLSDSSKGGFLHSTGADPRPAVSVYYTRTRLATTSITPVPNLCCISTPCSLAPCVTTGQGLNTAVEDAHQLGVALAGAGSGDTIRLDRLEAFRMKRAGRVGPIMAHTAGTAAASYSKARTVNATAADSKDTPASGAKAATLATAMGGDTPAMTAEQFLEYLYAHEWEPLAPLAAGSTLQKLTV